MVDYELPIYSLSDVLNIPSMNSIPYKARSHYVPAMISRPTTYVVLRMCASFIKDVPAFSR